MRRITILITIFISLSIDAQKKERQTFVEQQMQKVEVQYADMLKSLSGVSLPPRSIKDGKLRTVATDDWTSGFFAGSLWYLYQYTKDTLWLSAAKKYTQVLEKEKNNRWTHDLGFMLYCSYGNGYQLTGDDSYKQVLIQGAKTLCTRFHPAVGCIKSWEPWGGMNYPVIIDNMMNLEYLFWAFRQTGDSSFYKIAVSHADNTLKNHFRGDYSSYHVVDYDSIDGHILRKRTAQGAFDESAWARGQSWGLYGYTMMYRETNDKKYLDQAIHIADYIVEHLPKDYIPYWDYSVAQDGTEPRDASAAAIASSALFELSKYVSKVKSKKYFDIAEKMLFALSAQEYMAKSGDNFNFIIKHCTGHKPANSEIDVPLIYADYYYVEALMRYCGLGTSH
jgi:unsaturated chondroitin disaccharide hydrolase